MILLFLFVKFSITQQMQVEILRVIISTPTNYSRFLFSTHNTQTN